MATTHRQPVRQGGERDETHLPVLVAVDGSERNRSAVEWAAHEAVDGGDLVLLTVVDEPAFPVPHLSVVHLEDRAERMLAQVREEVGHGAVDGREVRTHVVVGPPARTVLHKAAGARLVVVGKRGLGAFSRVLVGSTSIAVAGRSPVPVVVVPDSWKQEEHRGAPLVLGIDPYRPHHELFHLAFSRAGRLGVPLMAVHGWETPSMYAWDTQAITGIAADWEEAADTEFGKVVDTWQGRFPEVEVRRVARHNHPAMAVLEAAEDAQLVLLGRHGGSRVSGFGFGSVTRAVLHYSSCPVMVVPAHDEQLRPAHAAT